MSGYTKQMSVATFRSTCVSSQGWLCRVSSILMAIFGSIQALASFQNRDIPLP